MIIRKPKVVLIYTNLSSSVREVEEKAASKKGRISFDVFMLNVHGHYMNIPSYYVIILNICEYCCVVDIPINATRKPFKNAVCYSSASLHTVNCLSNAQ